MSQQRSFESVRFWIVVIILIIIAYLVWRPLLEGEQEPEREKREVIV